MNRTKSCIGAHRISEVGASLVPVRPTIATADASVQTARLRILVMCERWARSQFAWAAAVRRGPPHLEGPGPGPVITLAGNLNLNSKCPTALA